MGNVRLDTVRAGVRLLSKVMKEADNQGNGNGRVSSREVRDFIDGFGDGGKLDKATRKIHDYAKHVSGSAAPSVEDVNASLGKAMKYIARGDLNKSKDLSPSEVRQLADTWKAIVDFSKEYRGSTIKDIVNPGDEAP